MHSVNASASAFEVAPLYDHYRQTRPTYAVDLPGFGYARVPTDTHGAWKELIEGYLTRSPRLKGVVHIVDVRHRPSDLDLGMMAYLERLGAPALIVATKMDKLKKSERAKHLTRVAADLGVDPEQLVPFSSHTGEGREELLTALGMLLEGGGEDDDEAPPEGDRNGGPPGAGS